MKLVFCFLEYECAATVILGISVSRLAGRFSIGASGCSDASFSGWDGESGDLTRGGATGGAEDVVEMEKGAVCPVREAGLAGKGALGG